ncbi:hypothetical protein ABZ776_36470, partial [Streptomyces sp. NPDC007076]
RGDELPRQQGRLPLQIAQPVLLPTQAPAPTPRPEAPTAATPPAEAESEVTMQVRLPVIPKSADTPGTATQDPYTGTEAPDPYAPETGAGSTTPDPYAIGPDRHERVGDETPEPRTAAPAPMPVGGALPGPRQPEQQPQPEPQPEQVEQAERITDKGLPKRTPRIVKPTAAPTTERKGSLDKEALRRRLGGFHQGAKDGRRDVEAEIAEITATQSLPGATGPGGHPARTDQTDETGDTVEEARS